MVVSADAREGRKIAGGGCRQSHKWACLGQEDFFFFRVVYCACFLSRRVFRSNRTTIYVRWGSYFSDTERNFPNGVAVECVVLRLNDAWRIAGVARAIPPPPDALSKVTANGRLQLTTVFLLRCVQMSDSFFRVGHTLSLVHRPN